MLSETRSFFAKRGVLEVDTPLLSKSAPIDTHIDVMTTHFADGQKGYLHTSPEYAIKRLLAECPIDLYQLSHVFREGEVGPLHNPEFTMIEWYRMGFTLNELIDETVELIQLFLGSIKPTFFSYQELFFHYTGMNPFHTTPLKLFEKATSLNLKGNSSWSLDTWLHFYMGFFLEPQMKGLTIVHSFPSSQAALSRLRTDGPFPVADRFEIFFNGIELANGFHELTDPIEQRSRFEKANRERASLGKPILPIDEHFLSALEKGLPDCCGVAAGFDRLLMLAQNSSSLEEVLPLTWDKL
jgi:lysyl-tRNA synthetase class 2